MTEASRELVRGDRRNGCFLFTSRIVEKVSTSAKRLNAVEASGLLLGKARDGSGVGDQVPTRVHSVGASLSSLQEAGAQLGRDCFLVNDIERITCSIRKDELLLRKLHCHWAHSMHVLALSSVLPQRCGILHLLVGEGSERGHRRTGGFSAPLCQVEAPLLLVLYVGAARLSSKAILYHLRAACSTSLETPFLHEA